MANRKERGYGDQLNDLPYLLPTPTTNLAISGADYSRAERPASGGDDLATALHRELSTGTDFGPYGPAIERWAGIIGRKPPAPTEIGSRNKFRLAAPFAEWMMGWAEGWVTSPDIGLTRSQALAVVGNGVVPRQALHALNILFDITEREAA